MAKRNDFMEGFLRGLYNSGVGNPDVQRQNEAQQQQQNAQLTSSMAEKGMLPPDHPAHSKIQDFVGSLVGSVTGAPTTKPLLASQFQPNPNFAQYYQDPQGKVNFTKGQGIKVPEGTAPITTAEGVSRMAQQNKVANAPSRFDSFTQEQKDNLAKAVYEGRIDPRTLGFRERTDANIWANEYALKNNLPSYKSYTAQVKGKTAESFTSGKFGQNVNSLNTALGHVETANKAYQEIQNTDVNLLNKPINWLKENTNDANVIKLGVSLNALRGELATVFKGSGGTDQEIASWMEYLNRDLTPQQAYGALETVDDLLRSRQQALEYQRSTGMSQSPGETPLISPKAAKTRASLVNSPLRPKAINNPLRSPTSNQVQLSPEDQQAIDWAKQNQSDPRAIKILRLHGIQ